MHFFGSAVLRANCCPHCSKEVKLRRSKLFVVGYILTLSASLLATLIFRDYEWRALMGALLALGGLASMVMAVPAGFREEAPEVTALDLRRE